MQPHMKRLETHLPVLGKRIDMTASKSTYHALSQVQNAASILQKRTKDCNAFMKNVNLAQKEISCLKARLSLLKKQK